MRILGIDSSTPQSSIALLENDLILAQASHHNRGKASSSILGLIHRVLSQAGGGLDAVEGFAVTTGPGSFTGLRVGLSLVKGFVLCGQKPVAGIDTLEAWAATAPEGDTPVCAILDARKNQVYSGLYRLRGAVPETLVAAGTRAPDAVPGDIDAPTWFVGTGLEPYGEKLRQALGERFLEPDKPSDWTPAACAARLAARRWREKPEQKFVPITLNYLRKPEAEINHNPPPWKGGRTMEIDPDLLEKVKSSNAEFKKLYEEHAELKNRVEELNRKKFLSPEQELEKKQIQKQKLQAKDRLYAMVDEYQSSTS